MEHLYFIAYSYQTKQFLGTGNHFIYLNKPIETNEDIRLVEERIQKSTNQETVVVINFKKLKTQST